MENIFYASCFLIFYAYIGYPLSLYFISLFKYNEIEKKKQDFYVTIIIAAYNEEKSIGGKIENTLLTVYPREKLQILIASDGSTDRTNEIVASYQNKGIELIAIAERGGKENAQKKAVDRAIGDILVFTDVGTMLDPSGVGQIVSNFAVPGVGCVSSKDRVIGKDGKTSGEGFYVRYEMWLRMLESRVNSLVGLSGSFFAARKAVCQDFSEDVDSDFRTVLNSVKMGLEAVIDPNALGYYQDVTDLSREFDRKVRTVLRGLTVFFNNLEFLNFLKYGFFSYQYLCHKLCRWLVPFFIAIAFLSSMALAVHSSPFRFLFLGQVMFYVLGLTGLKKAKHMSFLIQKIPVYFLVVNASILVAWWKYSSGQRIVHWSPSER